MNTQSEPSRDRVAGPVGPILMALLLVLGLVLGGGISYLLWAGDDESPASAEGCERYRTVEVAVAAELFGVVTGALDEVTPECTRVNPVSRPGGEVAFGVSRGGALPDIWIPEARFWMTPTFLGSAPPPVVSPSLAWTPLMLVGGPAAPRFDSWGEAEVSGFVSVPDPLTTTVGAMAVAAPQAEAGVVGRSPAQARQMLVPFAQKYGARRSRGLDEYVAPTTIQRRSPRLVVTTEQEFGVAQTTAPQLQDRTPPVGALTLDFPVAVPRDAAPGSRAVARALVRHLAGDAGREALREAGLRDPGGASSGQTSAGTGFLSLPPARSIAAGMQSWSTLAVPSSILAVVDASGSMDLSAGGRSRMELLAEAAGIGLSFLPSHARVGLWIFSIDKGGPGQDWRVLEPVRRLDTLEFGRTQRFALRVRTQELPGLTDGGTGLYDTTLAAYRQALRDFRPHYSNAVLLMTDGQNEDPGSIQLDALLDRLRELRDPQRPVRIVGLAIGADADRAALERIAEVTGGAAYAAEQPEDVLAVFAQAVLSR